MKKALALALLAACDAGPPIPATDLLLRVTAGAEEVAPGRAFPLTVVRVWSKDLVPAEWSDRTLAPLHLRLEEARRREDAARVEETRRYQARAFALGDVAIPAPKLRARPKDGGPERAAVAEPVRVRVRPELDPAAPGPPELPGEPPRAPFRWVPWAAAAAAALAALALARRRKRPAAAPAPPPPPAPHERALARLREIAEREPRDVPADFASTSAVLRDYVAERFAVRAAQRTTEELLAAPETAACRDALAGALGPCDLVKFAAHRPDPAERSRLLALAEAFVRGTAA